MGPVSFQSLFLLAPGQRSLRVIFLKTTTPIFPRCAFFYLYTPLSVCDVDPGIEGLVVLEHAVDDPQYFVHTDAHGGHIVLSVFLVLFVELLDQRIVLKCR